MGNPGWVKYVSWTARSGGIASLSFTCSTCATSGEDPEIGSSLRLAVKR